MKLLVVISAVSICLLGLLVPTAVADPIDDLLGCDPYAGAPRLINGNAEIVGNGHAYGPWCSESVATVQVCLDHNGVTLATSCRTYYSPSGGDSRPVDCLPGYWESMTIVTYKSGVVETAHTDQGGILVTTECKIA